MITEDSIPGVDAALLERIAYRAFAQATTMIHVANNRKDKQPGDPKVGGHPASCSSALHTLAALHLAVREPQDFVCCKPHASPIDHAFNHQLELFRYGDEGEWFTPAESAAAMHNLRKFPQFAGEEIFQSYHARSDPDHFHFLPSGSVGIPPVASVYLALAYRYASDHRWEVPENAHFWSLIGDSEFREGSLLEAMPDAAERMLGNVTWIVDYNRQNLDGTRIPNERGLEGSDCDRMERTALANGWRVIQVRHGSFRDEVFARPGGDAMRRAIEESFTDYEFQMLAFKQDASHIRERCIEEQPDSRRVLADLDDEEVKRVLMDVGGHCIEKMRDALARSRTESGEPYLVIPHTFKGWGMECLANPANHSMLPSSKEVGSILEGTGLTLEAPFELFEEGTAERTFLTQRSKRFREGQQYHRELRRRNREQVREGILSAGGIPESLEIDASLFPVAHTQWMWGQLATKLARIGTVPEADQRRATKSLAPGEEGWRAASEFIMTMSPDVGSSTNISPLMDARVYGASGQDSKIKQRLGVKYKHPEMLSYQDPFTRHIRFEIAEANAMSALGSFGKMAHYMGLPFFPIMTVYDFFIKRALDQLYYNLYWNSEFVIMGTPSGVTLSAEGAQHSWKSDIQIPNLITWEPLFTLEMDWILSDTIRRMMMDDNEGRRGVLIRAVTRAIPQALLLDNVRRQAASKDGPVAGTLKPMGAGSEWGAAIDESTLSALPDAQLLARVRADSLEGGWYMVDWRGFEGYEPGDNVVNVFAMGSIATEALEASTRLLERGIFANVIVISSPELLLGILGHENGYRHLREGLGITADLHAVAGASETQAGLISLAGRRVPCVAICDGEAGLVDNIGSIVGVKQETLAVRRFSKCGRPSDVYTYQGLDADAIIGACGRVLSETALEDLRVSPTLLANLTANGQGAATRARRDWRELWPDALPSDA
ncbi:MAG: pyruvate dehydrogenase E1 component [Chlamydiales bacterium]|jgi:pyruvate dehydrogenase E1 component